MRKVRMLPTKPYLPPRLWPSKAAGGGWRRGHSGLHPHAAVGHPGPEPALPVDAVLSAVLEADEADARPIVGEGVGDLWVGSQGEGGGRVRLGVPRPPPATPPQRSDPRLAPWISQRSVPPPSLSASPTLPRPHGPWAGFSRARPHRPRASKLTSIQPPSSLSCGTATCPLLNSASTSSCSDSSFTVSSYRQPASLRPEYLPRGREGGSARGRLQPC